MHRTKWIASAAALGAAAALGLGGCGGDAPQDTTGVGGAGGGGSVCGNSRVEANEECDSGGVETADCDPDCTLPSCGDGYLNWSAGERCDDGNTSAGDSCSPLCQPTPFILKSAVGQASATYQLTPSVGLSMVDGKSHFVVAWVQVPDGGGKRRVVKQTYQLNGTTDDLDPVVPRVRLSPPRARAS